MLQEKAVNPVAEMAIRRKAGAAGNPSCQLQDWAKAYATFVAGLARTSFCAVVLDYDGTLCDAARRYTGIGGAVVGLLTRMLEGGLVIGVATGRGQSVRDDLRSRLPIPLWPRVMVGYHSGSQVTTLDDEFAPHSNQHPGPKLEPLVAALRADPRLQGRIRLTPRLALVSVEPLPPLSQSYVWEVMQELVYALGPDGRELATVRSTYSFDVLAPDASKLNVVRRVRELAGAGDQATTLCIGDRGQWPGNDFELLNEPHSLSVDEVSANPSTCWNLAPPGKRGEEALLGYLRTATVREEKLILDLPARLVTGENGCWRRQPLSVSVSPSEAG